MIRKNEDKFLKNTFIVLAILLYFIAFTIKSFYKIIPGFNYYIYIFSFHFILSGAINSLLTSFFPKLNKTTIIYLCFVFGLVGAIPQLSPALSYLIPAVLSLYTLEKKFIFKITILNSIIFILSRMGMAFFEYKTVTYLLPGSDLGNILLGAFFSAFLEVLLVIGTAYFFFILITKRNERLERAINEKKNATAEILHFCSTTTSYHNKYLRWHNHGVKKITNIIIDGLREKGYDISDEYKEHIIFSVQFHDIGKIYIDSYILDKPGKLSEFEFNLVKEHPQRGFDLFNLIPKNCISDELIRVCRNVILQHHEKLDGSGYPFGLTETQISLEGKIVAIADVADALLSWRPYKHPMTFEKMMSIFDESKGKFLEDAVDVIRNNKDELIKIADKDNERLKEMIGFDESELIKQS